MGSHGKEHALTIPEIFFWILAGIILYTYLGYGVLVIALGLAKDFFFGKQGNISRTNEPSVTLLVPVYNEEAWLKKKIENSLALDYPEDKLKIIVITDGSTDRSADIASAHLRILHLHESSRKGKTANINRAMKFVESDIVVFSDANVLLNKGAIRELVSCFQDSTVGCVSGRKQIYMENRSNAASAGEGIYWRFESLIKKWEARLGSCVGASGELYAIRTGLFTEIPEDTINDDLIISLRIALEGYRIQYAAEARAMETASADLEEEFKRKIRIAAGNLQFILRLPEILNPFRHGALAVQFVSHKFLRSFIAPVCFLVLIPLNLLLLAGGENVYVALFLLQVIFYGFILAGFLLQKSRFAPKIFFVPMYIILMNVSVLFGTYRYLSGRQTVLWEKATRNDMPASGEEI